jgi:hypothetical protein
VAHACNPSYLGGRGWEDHSSMLAGSKKKVYKTLSHQKTKIWMWSVPQMLWEAYVEGSQSGQKARPHL